MTIIIPFKLVKAEEYPEITNDIEVRYKWYKEIIVGDYYPLKDIKEGDLIDKNNIIYGKNSAWEEKNCKLSEDNYIIEKKITLTYRRVDNVRYVVLENYSFDGKIEDNIKIYQDNKIIDYEVVNEETNKLKIDLKKLYMCQTLVFFIYNDSTYKITLYANENLSKEVVSKEINDEKILIPDKTWITPKTYFSTKITSNDYGSSDLMKETSRIYECSYKEKYVYKYTIKREYYDDNYHLKVDGYIKDNEDYKVYYKETPVNNTIEVIKEKIVKKPQIEYIYIPSENNIQETDSLKITECPTQIKTQIKTKIETVEKEIFKVPKIMYLSIIVLILTIMFLSIKLHKKYVDESI